VIAPTIKRLFTGLRPCGHGRYHHRREPQRWHAGRCVQRRHRSIQRRDVQPDHSHRSRFERPVQSPSTTGDGTATSLTNYFYPPAIKSFSPTNSAPGTIVTISGTNFLGATIVSFNGAVAGFTVTNNTTIGATVPAGVSTGPISITTPAGTATGTGRFLRRAGHCRLQSHTRLSRNERRHQRDELSRRHVCEVQRDKRDDQYDLKQPNHRDSCRTNATTGPITVTAPAGTATSASNFVLDFLSDLGLTATNAPDPAFVTSNLVYTSS